jgi:ATP-dependent helicase/nuclease subunit B
VTLHGKIDRIDSCELDGETYLRVVDYKSSQTTLEPAKTWWGLQLQLMIYLDAAVNAVPGAKPAGAFYFHVSDPLARLSTDEREPAEIEIAKQLQMKGVTLADEAVLAAMDHSEKPLALAGTLTRGGEVRKNAKALDLPQMRGLLHHSRAQAAELADALFNGDTSVQPVKSGGSDSCEYCELSGVCGFHADARGAAVRELPEMTMEDLALRLAGTDPPVATAPEI